MLLTAPRVKGEAEEPPEPAICSAEVGTILSPSEIGQQTYPLSNLTGKAGVMWTTQQTTDGQTTNSYLGVGLFAGPSAQASVAMCRDSGAGNFASDTRHDNDAAIITVVEAASALPAVVVEKAKLVSFGTNEFTLDWTTVNAAAIQYHYAIAGGPDVEANVVQTIARTSASPPNVTVAHGLSGIPDAYIAIGGGNVQAPPASDQGAFASACIGFGSRVGNRFSGTYIGEGGSDSYRGQRAALLGHPTGVQIELAVIDSADATNFYLDWKVAQLAEYWHILAMKGIEAKVGSYNSPSASSTRTVNVGFSPILFFDASIFNPTTTIAEDGAWLGIGAADGTNNVSAGVVAPFDDSSARRFSNDGKLVQAYNTVPTLYEEATASFSGSDVDIAYTEEDANEHQYLVLGCAPESSPEDVTGATLDMWLRADDISVADGGLIGSWATREGNRYDFAATAADRPTMDAVNADFNGQPTVTFAGTQHLNLSSAPLNSNGGHVFVVAKLATASGSGDMFVSGTSTSDSQAVRFLSDPSNTDFAFWQRLAAESADNVRSFDIGLTNTQSYIFEWSSDYNGVSGTYTLTLDGVDQPKFLNTGSDTGEWFAATAGRNNTTIGAWIRLSGEIANFSGDIAEIIVYDSQLSSADAAIVREYLSARYGITLP